MAMAKIDAWFCAFYHKPLFVVTAVFQQYICTFVGMWIKLQNYFKNTSIHTAIKQTILNANPPCTELLQQYNYMPYLHQKDFTASSICILHPPSHGRQTKYSKHRLVVHMATSPIEVYAIPPSNSFYRYLIELRISIFYSFINWKWEKCKCIKCDG